MNLLKGGMTKIGIDNECVNLYNSGVVGSKDADREDNIIVATKCGRMFKLDS